MDRRGPELRAVFKPYIELDRTGVTQQWLDKKGFTGFAESIDGDGETLTHHKDFEFLWTIAYVTRDASIGMSASSIQ